MKMKTETKSRQASICVSVLARESSPAVAWAAMRALPRMGRRLTRMDPKMEACTIRTWPLIRVTLFLVRTFLILWSWSRAFLQAVSKMSVTEKVSAVCPDYLQENQLDNVAQADIQERADGVARLERDALSGVGEQAPIAAQWRGH